MDYKDFCRIINEIIKTNFLYNSYRTDSDKMGKLDVCVTVSVIILSLILNFSVGITMIVVGEQYSDESNCKIPDISKCLEIFGGLMLGVSILFSLLTLGYVIAKQDAGKTLQPLILAIVLTQLSIMIWASITVFGKFTNIYFYRLSRRVQRKLT